MDPQSRKTSPSARGRIGPKQLPHRPVYQDQKPYGKVVSGYSNRNGNKSMDSVTKDSYRDVATPSSIPDPPKKTASKDLTKDLALDATNNTALNNSTALWYCCQCENQGIHDIMGPYMEDLYLLCMTCSHKPCTKCRRETTK